MPKVTMALSDSDARNASDIQLSTNARSKAHALSIALTLTRYVLARLMRGDELVLRTPEGRLERIVMPELENLRADAELSMRSAD